MNPGRALVSFCVYHHHLHFFFALKKYPAQTVKLIFAQFLVDFHESNDALHLKDQLDQRHVNDGSGKDADQ